VRNPYNISVGKSEDKGTLLKPSWRMKGNFKLYSVLQKDFKLRGLQYSFSPATVCFFQEHSVSFKGKRIFV